MPSLKPALARLTSGATLTAEDAAMNAAALRALWQEQAGPCRDTVLLNSAAGLIIAGAVPDLQSGAAHAARVIDGGFAAAALDRLQLATA